MQRFIKRFRLCIELRIFQLNYIMKKVILTSLLFSFALVGFSQVENPKRMTMYKVEKKQTVNTQSNEELIKNYQSQIEAINQKEEWLKSNPEENAKAIENGWYTDADKTRQDLRNKIKELENK